MDRKIEKIMAIVGAVLGFIGMLMLVPEFMIVTLLGASSFTAILGLLILLGSILGLVGAFRIAKKPKSSGAFLIVAAVIEIIPIFLNYFLAVLTIDSLVYLKLIALYIIPAVLMLIAGIICFIRKKR